MPVSFSALSFLHPAALWALAALSIPVLIHLFNRSRGRLVKIGHIDLIRNARKIKVTEVKLAQWLLLLLRLCLFALAALILAGLALPGLSSSNKATAYVSPAWLANAPPQMISELLQQYSNNDTSRIFLLQDDFPALDKQLADRGSKQNQQSQKVGNVWPLLAERLSVEQHLGTVEVYAVDNLAQFGASRPALPREVDWHLIHSATGNASVSLPVTAVVAYDKQHRADADVLNAALSSLKAYRLTGLSWDLIEIEKLSVQQRNVDWLILLSTSPDTSRTSDTAASPKVILTDAYGASRAAVSRQLRLPFYPFTEFRVSRTGETGDSGAFVGSGDSGGSGRSGDTGSSVDSGGYQHTLLSLPDNLPLLQQSQQGTTREIHFNSRFIPAWSSIAQQPEFPELLLQLLLSDEQQAEGFADAIVLPSQLQTSTATSISATPLPRRSLQGLLAALMALLWLAERWLSERTRRAQL